MDSITLTVAAGWSDHTSEITGANALLYIQAPVSYGADNASFMLVSVPGPRPNSSSHELAVDFATGYASPGPPSSVSDCTIGGEKASFFLYQYSTGEHGYRLLILHNPTSRYPFLYEVVTASQGQLDQQAAADIRAILGSWTWGSPIYDPIN